MTLSQGMFPLCIMWRWITLARGVVGLAPLGRLWLQPRWGLRSPETGCLEAPRCPDTFQYNNIVTTPVVLVLSKIYSRYLYLGYNKLNYDHYFWST